jgi:hypothetical protein
MALLLKSSQKVILFYAETGKQKRTLKTEYIVSRALP